MKQKNLVILLTSIFILSVLWLIFSLYHNHVTSTITDPVSIQIQPIEGHFNKAAIQKIKNRENVNPANEIISNVSPTPEPSLTPEESITPEPEQTSTESANTSGNTQ